jgi:phosphonate transport system substrate-binding protein
VPTTPTLPPAGFRLRRVAALAGAALLAVSLAGCGGSADSASGSKTCPNGKIRFGVEPFEDASKLIPAYKAIGSSLSKSLDCPVEVSVVDNYSAEVLAMKNGKLEIGQFGPLGLVFASQQAKAQPVASFGTADGKLSTYTAGIWVKKGSPITSVEDLKGHSLALSEPGSTSGDALPRQAIKQAGLGEKDVKLEYAGGHPESLLALVHGKVDAAEVNSQQLATSTDAGQFDASKFTKVWASDPIPNDPITVAGNTSPEFQKAVKKALLNLSPDDIAKVGALLDVSPPGPLLSVSKDDYQPLFALAQDLGLTEKDVS